MTFKLPEKVYLPPELDGKANTIYTRMAVYFDNNIYNKPEDRNDTLLYQYLYHLIYVSACKRKFFPNNFEQYDAFALYMATRIYMRYINPKHREKHGKIKSVVNYCDGIINNTKVDFQRDTFNEIIGVNNKGERDGTADAYRTMWENSIQDSYCNDNNIVEHTMEEISELPNEINKVIDETPYRNDKLMRHRLYMSILLSVLKSSTLSNSIITKIKNRGGSEALNDDITLELYRKESDDCITLWRLDDKYYNLIHLLTVKTKNKFSERLSDVRTGLELSNEEVDAVIMSAYGNTLRDNNEEI